MPGSQKSAISRRSDSNLLNIVWVEVVGELFDLQTKKTKWRKILQSQKSCGTLRWPTGRIKGLNGLNSKEKGPFQRKMDTVKRNWRFWYNRNNKKEGGIMAR